MPDTLTVACKIPNGLMLQVFRQETYWEPLLTGGSKEVKLSRPDGWMQKLNGPARAPGKDVGHQIINGFGLTHGVDADKFAQWLEQNKDSAFVRKGLVFAASRQTDAIDQTKEHREQVTGLEPIDPNNLPEEFKRKITTAVTA
jgi:hypothetical protein